MCQPIVQFCAGSTKPLIFAGSLLTLILALALAALALMDHSLFQQIDPNVEQGLTGQFYLQLVAAAYLIFVTAFGSFAAHYDQKHSIRALAIITTVNVALAAAAILFVPNAAVLSGRFDKRLEEASKSYDFTSPPTNLSGPAILPAATAAPSMRKRRLAEDSNLNKQAVAAPQTSPPGGETGTPGVSTKSSVLTPDEATKIWDGLQSKGCCGFKNHTDWKPKLPKSCCDAPTKAPNGDYTCEQIDLRHKTPCAELIGASSRDLQFILALIALVSLYLATVTGVSTYRTFHYNEASQNAYS